MAKLVANLTASPLQSCTMATSVAKFTSIPLQQPCTMANFTAIASTATLVAASVTAIPLLCPVRNVQRKEYSKPKPASFVKMTCKPQVPVKLSLQSSSGLRASNALDPMASLSSQDLFFFSRPSHDLDALKLNISLSSPKRRASPPEGKTFVEAENIQRSIETVETMDKEPVKLNKDDIEKSLSSIQMKSTDKENVQIDEVKGEKDSRTAETFVKNGTEVYEHNAATVSGEEISKNIVNETVQKDDHQSEHAELVEEAIKNSDDAEKISHDLTGDKKLEEDIIPKTDAVSDESDKLIFPSFIGLRASNALDQSLSFSGLRATNALDRLGMPSQGLFSEKINLSLSVSSKKGRARASRCVTYAMKEKFTEQAIKAITLSREEAPRLGHNFVGTEQILLGLIREGTGIAAKVLKSMGINLEDARVEVENIIGRGSGVVAAPEDIPFTPRAKRVLELSLEEARKLGHYYIGTEHLLLGILREGEGVAVRVLESLGVVLSNIWTQVIRMVGENNEITSNDGGGNRGGNSGNSKTPSLDEYGTNLTKLAEEGKLDPVVGREPQIERVIQILSRRTKNNPCLIGEPGVGKTAIAEGLAQIIASDDVPKTLEGKTVVSLDMGLLVAGTKFRGEFEERLKNLMEEIKQSGNIILFIDEVHTLIGAGAAEGAIDASNILKPALARGGLQCIGATTLDEYKKHIEKDPALERRFQPVKVPEPTVEEAVQILHGLRERYENHHEVWYTNEALLAAAQLSHQYISDRFLPDKAIDLIDEAGARVRLRHHAQVRELEKQLRLITKEKNEAMRDQDLEKANPLHDREIKLRAKIDAVIVRPTVTESDIQHVVSTWTGIPVEKVSSDESSRLLNMEETLHTRVIGQDEAVKAVSRAIRRARVGLKDPNRPIASFIFCGPTGVGKTELAKALAAHYLGSEEAMIRLDMSEYMERHTVSKLIGPPPGYVGYTEGGQLTEAVRRNPHSLILFDEIEKAHPDFSNMMLQILEDGRLTDSQGRIVDFKNTLIIMTSNVGSNVIEKAGRRIGFDLDYDEKESDYNRTKSLVTEELKQYFRPEFLNRLDETIVFRQLTKLQVKEIADIMIREVAVRLKEKGIKLQVTERFKERVLDEGYDQSYGARALRRAINRLLEDSMAEKMLLGEIKDGDSVIVDVDAQGIVVV